ncbi:DUF169 domain-containing protein [Methanobacterium petrolearium]|uniref:DUF169 domain-containing protein n=1 Tax=Methanobacterium petrolearium TaxID=710190 RepID=UPI001AE0F6A9|nr:DUF169 domain-containing protein [Methanobacterium petrolearium]MBP1946171.1 uncharacterized protein (DUF169 family) [Methanobacterium petrolearium]BDZ70684.1 hypothetical protein GCM10025861_12010 [Methanobacterium petrolearium]
MCDSNGYDFIANKLKEHLNLEKSPVAIKFVLREEDVPEGVAKMDGKMRHCELVQKASQGDIFYATAEEQMCKGGSAALGLEEPPEKIKTGEFYYGLGRFSSVGSARTTMKAIPKVDTRMYALVYAPLEKANFDPDVIVIIANPAQAMILSQALVYTMGGRVEVDFAGIQSICADAVAGPFTRRQPNITLGCSGSRQYADVKDDEVIIGLTGENIGCVVNALENMS